MARDYLPQFARTVASTCEPARSMVSTMWANCGKSLLATSDNDSGARILVGRWLANTRQDMSQYNCERSFDQPINQATFVDQARGRLSKQLGNQQIKQTMFTSRSQFAKQPASNRSTNLSATKQPVDQGTNQPTNRAITRSINTPICQATGRGANKPTNQ